MLELLIAAPSSGSGKTMITCGLLALMQREGLLPCAFKCGPDYIDPMFHRSVLDIESHNLDLFLSDEDYVRQSYQRHGAGHAARIVEGVMGYYDGVGGTTTEASAWHLADTLDLPVLLVIRPKGMGLSAAAQIKGMTAFRTPHHIRGVILNECSRMMCDTMKKAIEKETGIPVIGCLPPLKDAAVESRHLGLYTAGEVEDLRGRIGRIADALAENVDMDLFRSLFTKEEKADAKPADQTRQPADTSGAGHPIDAESALPEKAGARPRIAVADDEAFCFMYQESLEAFEAAGAELVRFSPVADRALPEGISALYFPGGYPELHGRELAANASMRAAVLAAAQNGMPVVAECGGFMYLQEILRDADGTACEMTGLLGGESEKKERLVRFGYAHMTAEKDSLLLRAGETYPIHEFHYWDTTNNGTDCMAVKPVSGRTWQCAITGPSLFAGFPHLYFAGHPVLAERFVAAAASYQEKQAARGETEQTVCPKKGGAGC